MTNSLSPLLLLKRPLDFILFVYLVLVTAFVQVNPQLLCDLLGFVRGMNLRLTAMLLLAVTLASIGVVTTIFLPRYFLKRQAIAAALLHFAAFFVAAAAGVTTRARIASTPNCTALKHWPIDSAEIATLFLVVVLTASVFTAVLNIITPQKADYDEVRERMRAYVQRVQVIENINVSAIHDLVQKACDSVEKARAAEAAPRYREYIQELIAEPLHVLLDAAKETPVGHPEEFLKRIGQRDPGLAPSDAVERISRAQREVERLCMAVRY